MFMLSGTVGVFVGLLVSPGCGRAPHDAKAPPAAQAGTNQPASKPTDGSDPNKRGSVLEKAADRAAVKAEMPNAARPPKSGVRIISTGPGRKPASGKPAPADTTNSAEALPNASPTAEAGTSPSAVPTIEGSAVRSASEAAGPRNGPAMLKWSELISVDTLVAESRSTADERLANLLTSLQRFNTARREVEWEASYLAAVAGMVELHESPAPWQARAEEVRRAALEIVDASAASGAANFNAAKEAFAKIESILNRTARPPGVSNPAASSNRPRPAFQWPDVAELSVLMKRMERAEKQLGGALQSEHTWAQSADRLADEAALVAALAQVGLAFRADEPVYVGWMRDLRAEAMQLTATARSKNFSRAKQSYLAATNLCKACHAKYRFESGEKF